MKYIIASKMMKYYYKHVALKRGLPRKFARFVLFRPIEKRSFNLLCVLDILLQISLKTHKRLNTRTHIHTNKQRKKHKKPAD